MKIIHLSTGHLGGAGLAARRLNAGLRASGLDSEFHSLSSESFHPQNGEFAIERRIKQTISGGFTSMFSRQISKVSLVTPFSSRVIDADLLLKLSGNDNPIFHIHNWFNMLTQEDLQSLSKNFKIVATLHDQRLFTGACHYSLQCSHFKKKCGDCPQLPRLIGNTPSRIFESRHDFSKISYITPSHWLKSMAESSVLLGGSYGEVIPNSFFGYNAIPRLENRNEDKIHVGFAAMDPNSWIKGGDLVRELTNDLSARTNFRFFSLSDFGEYKDFWETIDVLLVPSRADNSPNVIHEAKLWGVPVVATNTGGIPEILTTDFDSCIDEKDLNLNTLVLEIHRVFELSRLPSRRAIIAENHLEFLESSISRHRAFYVSFIDN